MQKYFELFRSRLSQLMLTRHITNYRLHKDIGCSKSTIANWLEGKSLPDFERIIALADYFDVSTDYLLGRTSRKDKFYDNEPC